MKQIINSSNSIEDQYRYKVTHIGISKVPILDGRSNSIKTASTFAMDAADNIFANPWETPEVRFKMLESLIITDTTEGMDVTPLEVEEYIDNLMSELDSRIHR